MQHVINDIITSTPIKQLAQLRYEVFKVIYITDNRIITTPTYDSVGTVDKVFLPDPGIIIGFCFKHNVKNIVLLHNHPYYRRSLSTFFRRTCDAEPSDSDIISTDKFSELLKPYGINVIDHIIVCPDESYYSFSENNLIKGDVINEYCYKYAG